MNRIKILAKEIADKIAAGEVIEAPVSVVKELVENAIDAESTQITVEIKNGGKDYIRVSDNGLGILKEDLALSILPHSTSKIRFTEDLNNITSLGFRGEALSSIAAVSVMEITSKTEGVTSARKLKIEGSEIIEECDSAGDRGTTVIVRDLFYNLPARRKFLKSDQKETAAISEFISRISLAYPDIRFRFICDGTIRFSTPGKGDIYQTILTVYSPQNAKKLLKLSADDGHFSLKGYVSSPLESRNNRKQQIFFVNGRLVSSNVFENAVKTAYSDKLFEGRYPSVYLFLEIDPSEIDVNVHPRKAEIKFSDEISVSDFIIKSIREALLDKNATTIEHEAVKKTSIDEIPVFDMPENDFDIHIQSVDPEIPVENIQSQYDNETKNLFKDLRNSYDRSFKQEQLTLNEEFEGYHTEKLRFTSLEPLSQIFVTYILASDSKAFYIIDQHAAHERIMYEKLLKNFNADERASQMLLSGSVIELDRSASFTAEECLPILDKMGFYLEPFGDSSYLLKEIPYFMELSEAETFLYEFFDAASEGKTDLQIRKDAIISRSCKSAVKAHDRLSISEMKALFEQLDECDNPYSCPQGRPTYTKFIEYDLERMFKRK